MDHKKRSAVRRVLLPLTAITIGTWLFGPQNDAQAITPPDNNVCNGATCDTLPQSVCSAAGFDITLSGYTPAKTQDSGITTYTYRVCSPPAGNCVGGPRVGSPCLDNAFCQTQGNITDPTATCSRTCATNTFRGLSHFDINFPSLGTTCLSANTTVTGTCKAIDNTPTDGHTAAVGNFVLGDGSCYTATSPVAKCDGTDLAPGDCIDMTLTISGETLGLGAGPTVVVDKEATTCTASCMQGPSCTRCDPPPPGDACLTRTIGFWGTHPWLTNNYTPVTVCGKPLGCNDASDGISNPSCKAGSCSSVMEGLGSNPGRELPGNPPYVSMVRQLTAAKLNLAASTKLFNGSACGAFSFKGQTISQWITRCESLCNADRSAITASECIDALDAFNNSQDVGVTVNPAGFDRPGIDDFGRVTGASSRDYLNAQGGQNGTPTLVIGKKAGAIDCR